MFLYDKALNLGLDLVMRVVVAVDAPTLSASKSLEIVLSGDKINIEIIASVLSIGFSKYVYFYESEPLQSEKKMGVSDFSASHKDSYS